MFYDMLLGAAGAVLYELVVHVYKKNKVKPVDPVVDLFALLETLHCTKVYRVESSTIVDLGCDLYYLQMESLYLNAGVGYNKSIVLTNVKYNSRINELALRKIREYSLDKIVENALKDNHETK